MTRTDDRDMGDLDMVAGGLILFYGKDAAALAAHQAERLRQSGDDRRSERWRRIARRVRQLSQRETMPAAV